MTKISSFPASHRLRSLTIKGGFLDGLQMEFAPGLNCIIGGRGTGKTSTLEFIRYALGLVPDDNANRRRIETLIEVNLGGGRIQVALEMRDRLAYTVSRVAGDAPIVLEDSGKTTGISLNGGGGFFRAGIFSQNEVEGIVDSPSSQLDLLDTFEAEAVADINAQIRQTENELALNAANILPLRQMTERLSEELQSMPGVEQKLRALAASSSSSSDIINKGHAQKALRDRERRAIDNMAQFLVTYARQAEVQLGQIATQARSQIAKDILAGANTELLTEIGKELVACSKDVDALFNEGIQRVQAMQARLEENAVVLLATHNKQDLAFQDLLAKFKEAQGQATERTRLDKHRNKLLAKKQQLQDAETQIVDRLNAQASLLSRLSELRDHRFKVRKSVVEKISASLAPAIRVSVIQYGNREKYHSRIAAALKEKEARLRHSQVAEKIANALGPSEIAEAIKTKDLNALMQSAGLNPDQAEKALTALSASDVLFEIETVELVTVTPAHVTAWDFSSQGKVDRSCV